MLSNLQWFHVFISLWYDVVVSQWSSLKLGMGEVVFLSTVRKNWKKILFGVSLSFFAADYGKETYQISSLIKSYCKEASLYGENTSQNPRKIIVVLNPAANKKKCEKQFRKYCEPILHLAGFKVDIVKTDSEGYAKSYVQHLKSIPDALVIAGGDGTVSEVLTGMMRRSTDVCPIALMPLGAKNDISKKYFKISPTTKLGEAKSLVDSAMYLVRGNVEHKSVIKIEQISGKDTNNNNSKPIYAFGYMLWGINRDITAIQEKYWFLGSAKSYFSAIFNAFNQNLSWSCKANICYSLPCSGCSNCVTTTDNSPFKTTWWTSLFVRKCVSNQKILPINLNCEKKLSDTISSSNVRIYIDDLTEPHKIVLEKQESLQPGYSFFYKCLKKSAVPVSLSNRLIECRTIKLVPDDICTGPSKCFSIDNEDYDVCPISLTLIPKAIQMYKQVDL